MSLQHKIDKASSEILSYATFQVGWDLYQGKPFDKSTLNKASEILELIFSTFDNYESCPDEIYPGPASDGSVDIEIEYDGNRLIFTIYPDHVSYYLQDLKETGDIIDEDDMFSKLKWLINNE